MTKMDLLHYMRARATVPDINMFTVRFYRLVRANRVLPHVTPPGMAKFPVLYDQRVFWRELNNSRTLNQAMRADLGIYWDLLIKAHLNTGEVYFVLDKTLNTVKELMFVDPVTNLRSLTRVGRTYKWDQGSGSFG